MKIQFRFVLIPILILALLLSMISFPIKTVQASEQLPTQAVKHMKFPNIPSKGAKVEIPEWRTANSKHYLKDDGTFVAEVSNENIFYQDPATKKWKDIDNNLVPSNKAGLDYSVTKHFILVKINQI